MKAWRKLKKKIKEARLMEELKDRQYYRKPSQIKQEKLKLKKRAIRKATKEAEDFRTMNGSRQR
jgi:ribosomal protein S21